MWAASDVQTSCIHKKELEAGLTIWLSMHMFAHYSVYVKQAAGGDWQGWPVFLADGSSMHNWGLGHFCTILGFSSVACISADLIRYDLGFLGGSGSM